MRGSHGFARLARAVSACAIVGLASIASAAVVPSLPAESSATSGVNTAIRSAPRVYQEYIANSELGNLGASTTLAGMQLRLAIGENWRPVGYVGSTWPSQPISLGTYTVTLSQASAQLQTDGEYLSTVPTFASYQVAPVTVFSGNLTIPAGAFTADGGATGVHSFGPLINFTTPYNFTAGNGLVIQINHGGYTPSAELNAFFATTGFSNGHFDAISSTASGTATAPNGFSSPYFINFVVPEPASAALIGLAGLGMLVRKRRV